MDTLATLTKAQNRSEITKTLLALGESLQRKQLLSAQEWSANGQDLRVQAAEHNRLWAVLEDQLQTATMGLTKTR
jgi:hypothetical protein